MQNLLSKWKRNAAVFLRWSEKYTKTDMVYLARGGFWMTIARGFGAVSGLILSIGYANLLPQESFGTYQFILSMAAIVSVFTLTGMRTSLMRAAARGANGALRIAARTHLKWSVGIAVAGLAAALYYFANDNTTLGISMLIVGAFAPFLETFKLYAPFLTGKQEFRKNTLIGIGRKVAWMAILLFTIALTDNPVILVFVYFVSQTVSLGLIFREVLRNYSQGNDTLSSSETSFSKHVSVLNVLARVAGHVDKILVFHFLGAVQLAVYAFALLPVKQIQGLNQIVIVLSFPKISRKSVPDLRALFPRKAAIVFAVFALLAGVYVLLAPFIFSLLFSQYQESVIFSQVFALILLTAPVSFYKTTFGAHLRKRESYISQISMTGTRIALALLLIPPFGIWGAIATLVLTNFLSAAVNIILFYRIR